MTNDKVTGGLHADGCQCSTCLNGGVVFECTWSWADDEGTFIECPFCQGTEVTTYDECHCGAVRYGMMDDVCPAFRVILPGDYGDVIFEFDDRDDAVDLIRRRLASYLLHGRGVDILFSTR